jgi:hypothetical protein
MPIPIQVTNPATIRVLNDLLKLLHPDEMICDRHRREYAKRERVIAALMARQQALLQEAEVELEVGDLDGRVDVLLDAAEEHGALLRELLDE